MIDVEPMDDDDPMAFRVTVEEGGSTSQHVVTMARGTYEQLTDGQVEPVRTIEGAFEFLLDREPKEQILDRFDVTVISRYFPEFEEEIGGYLD